MASTIKSVAVIGVGVMGNPMGRRIHAAGYDLTVCDRDAEVMQDFAAMGVRTASAALDCAECDAVIVLVATPKQMHDVVLAAGGLREGIRTERARHLIIMSTVSPQDMTALATSLAGMPFRLVDAPVAGGVVAARNGTLTFLAGGNEEDLDALRPLFITMGQNIFHCGPLGAGQTTKIVNNIVAISNLMISAEAYGIALANGLTLEKFIPALDAASGRSFFSRDLRTAPDLYAAAARSADDYKAIQSINRKDIDLAMALKPPDMALPAIAALRQLLDVAGDETLASWRNIAASPDQAVRRPDPSPDEQADR